MYSEYLISFFESCISNLGFKMNLLSFGSISLRYYVFAFVNSLIRPSELLKKDFNVKKKLYQTVDPPNLQKSINIKLHLLIPGINKHKITRLP